MIRRITYVRVRLPVQRVTRTRNEIQSGVMPPPRDVDVWMGSLPQGVDGARVRAAFERASFRPTRVVVKKRAFKRDG